MMKESAATAVSTRSSTKLHIALAAVLLILSLLTRFAYPGTPYELVFDEVNYGKHVNGYLTGEHTFSGHPPLAIELITLSAKLLSYNGSEPFGAIGDPFPNAMRLRFLPGIVGSLVPVAAYALAIVLGAAPLAAFLAGILLVFDNALVVQSRFFLPDLFIVLFGLAGLTCFAIAQKKRYAQGWLAAAGACIALAISVKWSAAGFMLTPLAVLLWKFAKALLSGRTQEADQFFRRAAIWFAAVPLLIYMSANMVHVMLSTKPGPGDPFVSKAFTQESVFTRVLELHNAMYHTLLLQTATHPYTSRYYTWPFMIRPVYYWAKSYSPDMMARVYLLGNPLVWWGSSLCLPLALFYWKPKQPGLKSFLFGSYVTVMFPFVFVQRATYLYHYLPALVPAVMIAVLWLFQSLESVRDRKVWWALMLVTLAGLVFFYFAPLTYGWPLTSSQYFHRMLFPTWQ
jgi:dolichyl-phosphate-mannose--protein O-mannosyl transferase